MKDFIKWLGVNEKIAKVVVWLLIIMISLIVFNTAMESIGFPYYAITYDNLVKIKASKLIEFIISIIVALLNFYSIVLLVFRVKEAKAMFKYAVVYLFFNSLFTGSVSAGLVSVFVFIFITLFCYFYSDKNWKYIIYAFLAFAVSTVVEGIWYLSKVRFIDYSKIGDVTKIILSIDYFIIMGIIILVKEIYLKKRSEKGCLENLDAGYGSANSKTKINSQRKSQKK